MCCGYVFEDCEDLTYKCIAYKTVVSRISNSCVGQAVIVIISIVSVKCEQWHKSNENTKKCNRNRTNICFYLVWK